MMTSDDGEMLRLAARLMRVQAEWDRWHEAALPEMVACAEGEKANFRGCNAVEWAHHYVAQHCVSAMGWDSYSDQGMEGRTALFDGSKNGLYLHEYRPWANDAQAAALAKRARINTAADDFLNDLAAGLPVNYAITEYAARNAIRRLGIVMALISKAEKLDVARWHDKTLDDATKSLKEQQAKVWREAADLVREWRP